MWWAPTSMTKNHDRKWAFRPGRAGDAAEAVLDLVSRRYRAALTIEATDDSHDKRKSIFKDFELLSGISQKQRLAAVFVVNGSLRPYFEDLSQRVIAVIDNWEAKGNNV